MRGQYSEPRLVGSYRPELARHASDFVGTEPIRSNFRVLIDPGYVLTHAYGLRWDAPKETAYPATFVIDREGMIRFANVSPEHAGRTPVADVPKVLRDLKRSIHGPSEPPPPPRGWA